MNTTDTGSQAEQAVAEELVRRGYKVIELNWKTPYAEIDIVAQKDKSMYFVEVKYRATESAGDGFDYITPKKLHHMQRAAESWTLAHNYYGEYQMLAVAVTGHSQEIDIREIS